MADNQPSVERLTRQSDYKEFANAAGIYRIPLVNEARNFMKNVCQDNVYFPYCRMLVFLFGAGFSDIPQMNQEILLSLLQTTPSDVSMKQVYHFMQLIRSGRFSLYDHGPTTNLRIYGTQQPPDYNVTKVTVPVAMYYGENDNFISQSDIENMIVKLPNVVEEYLIPYKNFNHGDFLWAKDLYSLLSKRILEVMEKY